MLLPKYAAFLASSLSLALAVGFLESTASGQITTRLVVTGLFRPLWAGSPPGDERIFFVQKEGLVRIVKNGAVQSGTFLNLTAVVSTSDEQGLLGMAFHPGYEANGWVFVFYSNLSGDSVLARYTRDAGNPDKLDPASAVVVLTIAQLSTRHKAGCIVFGPDGYLYVATGDSDTSGDAGCNAQNLGSLLGKILRLDVDALPYSIPADNPFVGVMGALPEIYHYGFRNPWRFSFDGGTGDMYIGDVGANSREEIDFVAAGVMGLNFGWKVEEGTKCNSSSGCAPATPSCGDPSLTAPIHEIVHAGASQSITCGYVYRGCAMPGEVGKFFFADFSDDLIRSFDYDPVGGVTNLQDRTLELAPGGGLVLENIVSFGEDGFGEILIVEYADSGGGEIYRIEPAGSPTAAATVENGSGTNALCYTNVSTPILGREWTAEVDTSGHAGATLSLIVGYSAPTSGNFFKMGEILVTGQLVFSLSKPSSGGIDSFAATIPCDAAISGLTAYTQALIFGGAKLELCNRVDLELAFF